MSFERKSKLAWKLANGQNVNYSEKKMFQGFDITDCSKAILLFWFFLLCFDVEFLCFLYLILFHI